VIYALISGNDVILTFDADDLDDAIYEGVEAIGLKLQPSITRYTTRADISFPDGSRWMVASDHEAAAGSLCSDDGTGCCADCHVALTTCDSCTGVGYHRAKCPESDDQS